MSATALAWMEPRPGLPRIVEVSIAVAVLVVSAPILVACALVVRLSSRGPVLFRQARVGLNGQSFTLFKFRSMRCESEGLQITADGDRRITAAGKFLRKTKLDELPELWNVLKGDMALVGPRPEVAGYVDLTDRRWKQVLQARPGLTDPVTVRLRNEQVLLAKVSADPERFYLDVLLPYKLDGYTEYLARRTWRSDLKVLWETCLAVFFPGSVYHLELEDLSRSERH